jgi:hypothetical protein
MSQELLIMACGASGIGGEDSKTLMNVKKLARPEEDGPVVMSL